MHMAYSLLSLVWVACPQIQLKLVSIKKKYLQPLFQGQKRIQANEFSVRILQKNYFESR